MKFRNSSVPFDLAQPKSIQEAAKSVGVSAISNASADAALAQFLSKKRRALLVRLLRDKGYTGIDETDSDWVVPVRDETTAQVRTYYTGNKLLNRLVFAINARFGSKGYMVDPDGHIAVLLRHPSLTHKQMGEDMAAVIADARLKRIPGPPWNQPAGTPLWHCMLTGTSLVSSVRNNPSFLETEYVVILHAVLDTAGPAIYIEWRKK